MTVTQSGLRRVDAAAVLARVRAGDAAGALRIGEEALALRANDRHLLHIVGVVASQLGNPHRGAVLLQRALRLAPDDQAIRANLVRALIDSGAAAEAERHAADHADPGLKRLRAEALRKLGRAGEAARLYTELLARDQNDVELWNNLGTALLDEGDADRAASAFGHAAALAPEHPLVRLNLARARAASEDADGAVAAAEAAVATAPEDAEALLLLGQALNRARRHADAIPRLADAARIDRRNPDIFIALGLALVGEAEFDRAEQAFRFALAAAPASGPAHLQLGLLLEQGNRAEELDALVADARARGVGGDEIACLAAISLRRKGDYAAALDAALAIAADEIDPILRHQLVGQLADRLKRPDIAFPAFVAMNDAVARDWSARAFDGTEHRRYVERLDAMLTPEWLASWPALPAPAGRSPVFLVGFPRSGTTLMDTVLMGHPGTHVLEEEPLMATVRDAIGDLANIPALGEGDVEALRRLYFAELERIAPAPTGALVIDKLPLNLLRAPLIHRLFPDAKFIFAIRHPCDAVLSCWMQTFRINQAMASFLRLDNAALLYDRAFGFWQRSRELMGLNVHPIRYEDLLADFEGEVRGLLGFLDLPWDERVLDYRQTAEQRGYVRTPSYAQITEGLYARAQGRWTQYREPMAEVLPLLAPWAERLGYGDPLAEA